MIFKIICSDLTHYYYNSTLSHVYDSNRNLIDFSKDFNTYWNGINCSSEEHRIYFSTSKIPSTSRIFNISEVKHLEITIGYKCNYSCKYCIMHDTRKDLDEFDFSLFKCRLNKSNVLNTIHTVKLTGGEPFVYWDRFKEYVKFFREDKQFKGRIQTVTNGELFNEEIFRFCLDNKIEIYFSHNDIAQTYYRHSTDYLSNKKIRSLIIDYLKHGQSDYGLSKTGRMLDIITPKSPDIFEQIKYFNKTLYDGVPLFSFLPLKVDKSTEYLLDDWTEETLNIAFKSFLIGMLCSESNKYYNYFLKDKQSINKHLYKFVNRIPSFNQLSRCPYQSTSNQLAVDYNGNVISCWGTNRDSKYSVGSIDNPNSIKFNFKTAKDNLNNCQDCLHILTCGNACPILEKDDHTVRCRSLQPLMKAQTYAIFTKLLNKEIKEIYKCDQSELYI